MKRGVERKVENQVLEAAGLGRLPCYVRGRSGEGEYVWVWESGR